jgi:signal transduction histidine kinase
MLKMKLEPGTVAETLAVMQRQIEHITRLIDDLLDISRIGRGMLELRRQAVSIEGIVAPHRRDFEPAAATRHQQIMVNSGPERLFVDGDPVRLHQVVSNLAHNALKFSPEHGHVEISTRAERETVIITVKDRGIGFPPGHEERMF